MREIYDVRFNQDFIDGKKTKEEILEEFLNQFDGTRGNKDGKVSWEEWIDYYAEIRQCCPDAQYFVEMMESVW